MPTKSSGASASATSSPLPARISIGEGVHFTNFTDEKFTRNRISLKAIVPLSEATAADNTMVTLLLRKATQSYPDFTALNARLSELYGAVLATSVARFNYYQILTLTIQCIDNRFALEGEDIIALCAELLSDIFLRPVLDDNDLFQANDIRLEKQYLLDTIAAEINDKRTYAVEQCVRTLAKGTPLAVRRTGEYASAEKVTQKSVTKAWETLRKTAQIEILFTGSGDPTSAKNTFEQAFSPLEREPISLTITPLGGKAKKVQQVEETMDVQQGNLVLAFRVDGLDSPEEKFAARVFSTVFGASPFSKLFLNVRERLSLCYYCSSSIDIVNHAMLVNSGIEFANKEKAEAEILHQLEEMKQGNFSDELLAESKLLLKNALNTITDSLGSLENRHLQNILLAEDNTIEQDKESISKVTKEDIVAIANKITLDTVYFLHGEKGESL